MRKIIIESKVHGSHIILVDNEDYKKLSKFKWCLKVRKHTTYAQKTFRNPWRTVKMHRFIMGITDPKIQVDHKDGNGLNNQKSNLRICNNFQNSTNRKNKNKTTSLFIGVIRHKNSWSAKIRKGGERICLGRFKTEGEAVAAYNEKAMELHGHVPEANLSFCNNVSNIVGGKFKINLVIRHT